MLSNKEREVDCGIIFIEYSLLINGFVTNI